MARRTGNSAVARNPGAEFAAPKRASTKRRGNQAGRPTAKELERRKHRVMEVATQLFIERGYAATSLVDIAKGAGVATRTLYQHFGDKEALFREVVFARDLGDVIHPPVIEDGDTLVSILNRVGRYACDVAFRERSVDLMRLMIAESNRFPEFMQKVATAIFSKFQSNVRRTFEEMAELKLIPEGDYARMSVLFVDLILGSAPIMNYMHWSATPPTSQDIESRVNLFVNGAFGPAVSRVAHVRMAKLKNKIA
jgi:TetR/AcrR family transcriptional regulator, mexJK operon transcriptional repressor